MHRRRTGPWTSPQRSPSSGGGVIVDRDGGPERLDSEGVVAGGPAVVEAFTQRVAGRRWR